MTDLLGEELAMKVAAWINSAPLLRYGGNGVGVCVRFFGGAKGPAYVCIDTQGRITVNGQRV